MPTPKQTQKTQKTPSGVHTAAPAAPALSRQLKRFAVVVPAHNAAPHLRDCLEQIALADRCGWDMQVIVLDDGSRDSTYDTAAKAMADWALQGLLLQSPKPQGVGMARRQAIAAADAEVIMQVDSDDLVRPHRFRDALRVLQDPEVMLTAGNIAPFLDLDGQANHANQAQRSLPTIVMPTASEDVAASLLFYCPIWGGVTSFKTQLLKTFEMPAEAYGEDWCVAHRLVQQQGPRSVRNSGTTLIDYRRHATQTTSRAGAYMESIMPVWAEILKDSLGLTPDRKTFELHCRCAPYAFRETALLSDAQWQHWLAWAEELQDAADARGRVPHATRLQIKLATAQLSMRRQAQRSAENAENAGNAGSSGAMSSNEARLRLAA